MWERLARTLDGESWITDERFVNSAKRSEYRDALQAEIESRTTTENSAVWIDRLNEAGVPCGPINTIDQVFADPQVKHLGIAQELNGVSYVGQPMKLSRTPSTMARQPPEQGEDTDAILTELGFTPAEIADARARTIV
jgi:formyl-CoA transferase